MPVRLIAVGAVVILVAAAAAIMIPRGGASDTAPATTAPAAAAATTAPVRTKPPKAAATRQPRPARHAAKRSAAIVGAAAIERALRQSPVVVVAAVQPVPVVDRETAREAKAGADTAGVPYVELDVLDEKQARQLFTLLEQGGAAVSAGDIPSTPQVMVFTRPRKVAVRFSGYVDRQIVAQAAAGAAGRPGGDTWQKQANAICSENDQRLSQLPTSQFTGSSKDIQLVRRAIAMVRSMTASLARVHVPAAKALQYRQVLSQANEVLTQLEQLLAAYQRGQGSQLMKAYLRLDQISADVVEGFVALGLTSCV
jgi:hypothetical protein